MKTNSEPTIEYWTIIVGPQDMHAILHSLAAKLARQGAVVVLDCGKMFWNWLVSQELQGKATLLDKLQIRRVNNCQHLLRMLEGLTAGPAPVMLLDFLRPFYDESVPVGERKRILRECLGQISRLEKQTAGVIFIQPTKEDNTTGMELLNMVMAAVMDPGSVQVTMGASEFFPFGVN